MKLLKKNKIQIIAEMACSHNGRVQRAKKIADAAAQSGADIIQLQIWELQYLMSPKRSEFNDLKKIELTKDEWISIVKYIKCKYPKLKIYVCIYEHMSIDFIKSLKIHGLKINSSDLSNPLVLKLASTLKLPINLSVGASSLPEIKSALKILKTKKNKINLMYGQQNFPTKVKDINLITLPKLFKYFKKNIGYQDHCDGKSSEGFLLPSMSIALGAKIIEKHLTLDRNQNGFDYESALLPNEFKKFVNLMQSVSTSLGKSLPRKFSKSEEDYRKFQKKSIVANRNLNKMRKLRTSDITFLRSPNIGIQPIDLKKILGKKLKKNINKYSTILFKDLY